MCALSLTPKVCSPGIDGRSKTALRVSVDSLHQLATKSAKQPPIPPELPDTHKPTGRSGGVSTHRRGGAGRGGGAHGGARGGGRGGGRSGSSRKEAAYTEAEAEAEGEEEADTEADKVSSGEDDNDNEQQEAEAAVSDRTGANIEVQQCNPDECEMVCGNCDWEPAVVTRDHGRSCDVQFPNGDTCCSLANRFLRAPTATDASGRTKRARR